MAIAYKSAGAGASTETSGAACSPASPATVDANDILIIHAYFEGTATAPSTPSGFTLLSGPHVIETTIGRHWIYGKIAAGTEDGAANALGSQAVTTMRSGRCYSFSGFVGGSIADLVVGFAATSHATDPQMPTVTTTVTGGLAVACVVQNDNNALAAATGETGGDWVEAVAEFVAALTPGLVLQLQTCTPTGDPGTVTGGAVAATNDPSGVIGFEIRPNVPPVFPVIGPRRAQLVEAQVEPLHVRPKVLPFPYFAQPPPPASPVVPTRRGQLLETSVPPITQQPRIPFPFRQEPLTTAFIPSRVSQPANEPQPHVQGPPSRLVAFTASASPVISPRRDQLLGAEVAPRVPPPAVLPFPYFEAVANPVIAPRRDQLASDQAQPRVPPPQILPFPYFEQPASSVIPPRRDQVVGDEVKPRVPPPFLLPFPYFKQPANAVIAPRRDQQSTNAPLETPRIVVAFPFFQQQPAPSSPAPRLLMIDARREPDRSLVSPFVIAPPSFASSATLIAPLVVVAVLGGNEATPGPLFMPFPFGSDFLPPSQASPILWPLMVAPQADRQEIRLPRCFLFVGAFVSEAFADVPGEESVVVGNVHSLILVGDDEATATIGAAALASVVIGDNEAVASVGANIGTVTT